MSQKHAGLGAAILVLAAITGLAVLFGVIVLMMWFHPRIENHPSMNHGGSAKTYVASTSIPMPLLRPATFGRSSK